MKTRTLFTVGILLLISVLLSCNKDNTPPVITINGENPLIHCIDTEYVDPGATAYDEEDGNITDKIVAAVNVNTTVEDSYTVVYTVEDAAGNTAVATRNVEVIYCK